MNGRLWPHASHGRIALGFQHDSEPLPTAYPRSRGLLPPRDAPDARRQGPRRCHRSGPRGGARPPLRSRARGLHPHAQGARRGAQGAGGARGVAARDGGAEADASDLGAQPGGAAHARGAHRVRRRPFARAGGAARDGRSCCAAGLDSRGTGRQWRRSSGPPRACCAGPARSRAPPSAARSPRPSRLRAQTRRSCARACSEDGSARSMRRIPLAALSGEEARERVEREREERARRERAALEAQHEVESLEAIADRARERVHEAEARLRAATEHQVESDTKLEAARARLRALGAGGARP